MKNLWLVLVLSAKLFSSQFIPFFKAPSRNSLATSAGMANEIPEAWATVMQLIPITSPSYTRQEWNSCFWLALYRLISYLLIKHILCSKPFVNIEEFSMKSICKYRDYFFEIVQNFTYPKMVNSDSNLMKIDISQNLTKMWKNLYDIT